jgi:phosphonate transport system substrate-binding protein
VTCGTAFERHRMYYARRVKLPRRCGRVLARSLFGKGRNGGVTGLLQISARIVLALLLSVPLHSIAAAPAAVASDNARDELVLARVSDNPKDDYQHLKPLLDYVVPRMADVGIRRGRVLMAQDNQQMISYLRRGKVDWVTETAGAAMAYQERGGARLLLATARAGRASYQSVFFARRDSGIQSLADLRGRSLAFQSSASTSAYFLPASAVLAENMPLVILATPADRASADVVGFVFARSEFNIATWVHKGLVDAGAFGDQDWSDLERLPASMRNDLVVFHRTSFVPRALELVRGDLAPEVEQRLRLVLLAAETDPAAVEPLRSYWRTTAFHPVDDATRASLDRLRVGVARIHAEVE